MNNLRKEYWQYVKSEVLKSIEQCEDYGDTDYMMIKLNILANVGLLLENEEKFNDDISVLMRYRKK